MRIKNIVSTLLAGLLAASAAAAEERKIAPLIPEGAVVEKVADGFKFTEGPCWDYSEALYFSNIPSNQIVKLTGGKAVVWRDNSGGANGLICDAQHRLVACEGSARRVARCVDGSNTWETLADSYGGKKLNAPNDLAIDTHGRIYFTDPYYGNKRELLEQDKESVYRIDTDGKVTRIVDDTKRCNGIAISPDGQTLYVVDNGDGDLHAYSLKADGSAEQGRVIAQTPGGDGMCVDEHGNLYVTCQDGVRIFDRDGKWLETIKVPENPANCTFGGPALNILFITARTSLYKIPLNARGWQVQLDGLKKPGTASSEDYFAATGTEWYSAFNQPAAQHFNGKTYIAYPDADYDPAVICFDHARRSWSTPVKVGRNPLAAAKDSHGNPALLIDKSGTLHVFYGCHGGPLQYARSAKPENIEQWQALPAPAPRATYPQVMQMSSGTITLFYRAGGHCDDWVCRTTDRGDAWSQPTAVLRGVPPNEAWYASFAKGPGDTVHAGFVYKDDRNLRRSRGPEFTHRYDAYYMQRRADGSWINAAGQALTLPVARTAALEHCLVYDSFSRREQTGACSVGVDASNTPYLLFRTAGMSGAKSYQHKLARLQAGAWDIVDVGPPVEAGFEDFVRDDNFQLEVLPGGRLRAFVVNTIAGTPAKTDLTVWGSDDSGTTWRPGKTIFSSTNYPAAYVLISPKLVAEAHRDGDLIFGVDKRYLYGDGGFVTNPHPE